MNKIKESITCPNCGNVNEHGGYCEYCGSPLNVEHDITPKCQEEVNETKDANTSTEHNTYSLKKEEHNGVQSMYTEPYELPNGKGDLCIKLDQTSKGNTRIYLCISQIMKERYEVLEISSTFWSHEIVSSHFFEVKSGLEEEFAKERFLYRRPSILYLTVGNETVKIRPKKVKAESLIENYEARDFSYKTQREVWNVCYPIDVYILKKLCENDFERIDIKAPIWMGGGSHLKSSQGGYSVNVSLQTDARFLYNYVFDSNMYKDTLLSYKENGNTLKEKYIESAKIEKYSQQVLFEGTREYNKRLAANIYYIALLVAALILHIIIASMLERDVTILWLLGYSALLLIGAVSKTYFRRVYDKIFYAWGWGTIICAIYSLWIQIFSGH